MARVKVKICGITSWTDARGAIEAGADILGFNFYAPSPRYIAPEKARRIVRRIPKKISTVGIFVNEREEEILKIARLVGLDAIQLHGDEPGAVVERLSRRFPVIKAVRVARPFRASRLQQFRRANALLLDGFDRSLYGGTGRTFDWQIARRAKHYGKVFLSGGLTPENVAEAIRAVRPYAVDVCSGVEARPGKKDRTRMKAFVNGVKNGQVKAES
jgi:phosphoribosylanthranilate isomerase